MENTDDQKIEAYLRGEMSAEDMQKFEQKLEAAFEQFRQSDYFQDLPSALRQLSREGTRSQVEHARDQFLQQRARRKKRTRGFILLAILAGLFGFGYLFFWKKTLANPSSPSDNEQNVKPKQPDTQTTAPDTLQAQPPKPKQLVQKKYTPNNQLVQKAPPPIAETPPSTPQKAPPQATILVAAPDNKEPFLNSPLPASRIRIVNGQKTVEPLPAIWVDAYDNAAMRCVFYGDRIKIHVPAKLVEGQPIEILELRGTWAEDGFYLRIGKQFFRLETGGYTFDLKPVLKPNLFD